MQFVTRGYEGETVGSSKSYTKLEIKGTWHIQGRQAKNQVPREIIDLFKTYPKLESIALNFEENGCVYSR